MKSVQVDSVSNIAAQLPETDASPNSTGTHLGRTVVSSQPCSCTCPSNHPPPSYEEATRSARINAQVALHVINERERLLRHAEQERRAEKEGCCESLCDNGRCADLTLICCYIACSLCLSFCD